MLIIPPDPTFFHKKPGDGKRFLFGFIVASLITGGVYAAKWMGFVLPGF